MVKLLTLSDAPAWFYRMRSAIEPRDAAPWSDFLDSPRIEWGHYHPATETTPRSVQYSIDTDSLGEEMTHVCEFPTSKSHTAAIPAVAPCLSTATAIRLAVSSTCQLCPKTTDCVKSWIISLQMITTLEQIFRPRNIHSSSLQSFSSVW